jgi:cell wall-associated NlpC family hydrolase
MRLVEPLTDAERVLFIAAARAMRDTKFRHRGRSTRGVDCVGLVAMALAAVGRTVEDRKQYSRNPERDGLLLVCSDHFGDPVDDMRAGDVVAMSWQEEDGSPLTNHVGILFDYPTGGLAIVHALKRKERVVEHRLSDEWVALIDAVYRP